MTSGPADEAMRAAFGAALDQALRNAGVNVVTVATHVGLSDDAVRKWINGKSEPQPRTVFAVEQLLKVAPGDLSHHLGYVPTGGVSVAAAVEADPVLTPKAKEIVLGAYRAARR